MVWVRVKVYTETQYVESLCDALQECGASGFQITDKNDFIQFLEHSPEQPRWDYADESLDYLKTADTTIEFYIEGLSELDKYSGVFTEYGHPFIETETVDSADWEDNWKQYFKPFTVGDNFYVVPSWEEVPDTTRRIIRIDPGNAFGTGQHATTSLCIAAIEKYFPSATGNKFLDLGTGSGILTIAAALVSDNINAAIADISDIALETAKENIALNCPDLSPTVYSGDILADTALYETIRENGVYNIVCANIMAEVLIAMSPLLPNLLAPNGKLILSGIITERLGAVKAAFEGAFDIVEVREHDGWECVVCELKNKIMK
ncbi:MAG: 50S ribosomal protein L11 methyltransferase [Oscillospiraceae bacterium]|jgi:ribosomal protein L11 methyltransferase|nr:50S ribosomal protein L11 methyltransferase [Oscillospiraceae bacterium]